MGDDAEALVLDLLEWIGSDPRPYQEVMEAWRTSCPRLPVWEEANDRGFIERRFEPGRGAFVSVTTSGYSYLQCHRPVLAAAETGTRSQRQSNRSGHHRSR